MNDVAAPYRYEPAVAGEDDESILRVWADNLAHPEPGKKFRWLYSSKNPASAGLIYLLKESKSNDVVGVSCLAHRQFVYQGQQVDAGILADFAVDQKHRSLGPALTLTKTTVEAGKNNFNFLFGFPNRNAQPVMKRAGCEVVGEINRYARVMESREFLENRLPHTVAVMLSPFINFFIRVCEKIPRLLSFGYRLQRVETFDEDFDSLYAAASQRWFIAKRDTENVQWRHCKDPEAPEKHRYLFKNAKDELVGYIVYKVSSENSLIVDDLMADSLANLRLLLLHSLKLARSERVKSVSLEFFGDPTVVDILKKLFFRARGSRPIVGVVGGAERTAEGNDFNPFELLDSWFLTSSDEDG